MGFQSGIREAKVARAVGMDAELSLPQACADFYILERLVSDENRQAKSLLSSLERRVSKEFSLFTDMTLGGELRHAQSKLKASSNNHECDCFCEEDGEVVKECACCTGECGQDERTSIIPHDLTLFFDLFHEAKDSKDNPVLGARSRGWLQWLEYRQRVGLRGLDVAVETFNLPWRNGYGGPSWALIASVVRDFYFGRITPRTFIDRCWTLEHNGGNIFTKLYNNTDTLQSILQHQAKNNYKYLLRYTSSGVTRTWSRHQRIQREEFDMDPMWIGVQSLDGEEVS